MKKWFWRKLITYCLIFTLGLSPLLPNLVLAAEEDPLIIYSEGPGSGDSKDPLESLISLNQDLESFTNYLSIDKKRISMDAFDRAELEKYVKLYAQLKANPEAMAEYQKTGNIPEDLKKDLEITIDPSTYDIRILQALIHLVTPKELGGAGREFIKVGSIVRGYTSERKARSGRQTDPEQEVKDPEDYYSSHYKEFGQAVDISEIDYLRGTRFVYIYEDGDLKEIQKFKLPKIPIQVGWQTEEVPEMTGGGPEILGQSMNQVFAGLSESLLGQTVLSWLEDQGIDIKLNKNKLQGKNSAQILQELGLAWLKENYDLPANLDSLGPDLGSSGEKIGQAILAQVFNDVFPPEGFQGETLDDLLTNLGQEYVSQQMNLPYRSLEGQTSEELFANIGQSKIEDELGLSRGSLKDLTPDNQLEKIGQGYVENTLHLKPGSFKGENLSELETNLGSLKFREIFDKEKIIIQLLGINSATMEKLKNGEIKEFLQKVGEAHLSRTMNFYQAQNSAFNLELKKYFLAKDNPDFKEINFKEIGQDVVAKALSTDEETRKIIKKWLETGLIEPTSKNGYLIPKINEEYLAGQYHLAKNDLWRIFINDQYGNLRANEVFYRIGKKNLELALKKSVYQDVHSNVKNNPDLSFYESRVQDIKKEIQLLSLINNDQIKNIQDRIKEIEDYQGVNFSQLIIKSKKELIIEKADEIQKEIKQLEKNYPYPQIKTIKKKINEIIEGKEEINLASLEEKDLYLLASGPYSFKFIKENLIKVLQEKESPNKWAQESGLAELADLFELQEEDDLIKASQRIAQSPAEAASILQSVEKQGSKDYLQETINQINNILTAFGFQSNSYPLSKDDLINLFLGQTIDPVFKIGAKVSNEAFGFLPDRGLKELIEGSRTIDEVLKGGGLARIYRFLALSRAPESLDNLENNLNQAYAEEFLGLAKGALTGVNLGEIIAKNGDKNDQDWQKLERFLLALGIKIPDDIFVKRDFDLAGYQNDLKDFFEKLKKSDFDFWKNPDHLAAIAASVSIAGWEAEKVEKLITGQASISDLLSLTDKLIKEKLTTKELDGTLSLNDFLDLSANLFDNYQLNETGLGTIFNSLEKLAKLDLDSKLGFPSGTMADVFSHPEQAQKIFLEQGIRTLSKIFVQNPSIDFLSKETLGIHYDFEIKNPLSGEKWDPSVENWNLFGLVYKDGLGKEIPIKIKIPSVVGWQDDKVVFWDPLKNNLSDFTKIPLDFGTDLERFLNGDAKGALLAWGAAQMTYGYQEWVSKLNSQLPVGKTLGGLIDYDKVKKAYFDLIPSLDNKDFEKILTDAFNSADGLNINLNLSLNILDFTNLFGKETARFFQDFKDGKKKDIEYALIDKAIGEKLGLQAPGPGFAKIMLEGKSEEKLNLMKNWLDRTVNMPGVLADLEVGKLSDLVEFFKNPQTFNLDQLSSDVFNNLDTLLGKWLGQQIPGMGGGLINYFVNPNQPINLPGLGQISPEFLAGQLTGILDNSLGLPAGTANTIWQSYQNYQEALAGYQEAIQHFDANQLMASRDNLVKAEQTIQMNSANFVSIVVNLAFGKTFSQMDQSLGLPSGTTSLLVTSIIYSVMVPGVALGAFFWPLLLPVLGQIFQDIPIIGALLGGLFGSKEITTRQEIIYAAAGYYPGFNDELSKVNEAYNKAKETNSPEDWLAYEELKDQYDLIPTAETIEKIPEDGIEITPPAEFHAENQELFKQGAKTASQYKIRTLLANVLTMDEKLNDEEMLPTQMQTYHLDDVKFFSKTRDRKYGYKDEKDQVVSGSADKEIEAGSRKGFGYNKTMTYLVYFAY